jgi:hypothetical protein
MWNASKLGKPSLSLAVPVRTAGLRSAVPQPAGLHIIPNAARKVDRPHSPFSALRGLHA